MKIFQQNEILAAYQHAAAGGQALHVCQAAPFVRVTAPQCFRRSSQFAHLFDQDHERLLKTAAALGIRRIVVEYPGTHRQHVDLCAKPLERAIERANRAADEARTIEFHQEFQNEFWRDVHA